MKVIMPRIKHEWCNQLIILDGGSTDGTIEWAKAQGFFVYVQKTPGIRHAYREVMPYVDGDIIITFSPDGNSIPELLPTLLSKIQEGFDMVIASRYLENAKSEDDTLITAMGNWLFTNTINLIHGGKYTDALVIYRAYKKELVYSLDLLADDGFILAEKLFNTKLSWEPLLSVRAAKKKKNVTEIPGDEPARIKGHRKLQIFRWGAAYYFQIIREVFFWK
ncbi:MAG: glycosyltransferase [Nitrospirae bacterium]|nr:glycosyltransferase [Nitrospirota bacterium]